MYASSFKPFLLISKHNKPQISFEAQFNHFLEGTASGCSLDHAEFWRRWRGADVLSRFSRRHAAVLIFLSPAVRFDFTALLYSLDFTVAIRAHAGAGGMPNAMKKWSNLIINISS